MSVAERYLSYATPPIISSDSFTTEFIPYQPSGSEKTFNPGDSFTISLANLNKAQYLLPDSCFLTFDVTVNATSALTAARPRAEDAGVMSTVDTVPRPAWGLPYFDQASCSVPGSASFDALPSSAEETAQYWYSTRLLASSCSAEGTLDRGATFKLPGRYNYAGGFSGLQRAGCITGQRNIRTADGAEAPVLYSIRGNSLTYAVPLSAFCTLFCKSSSLIPIGMLSSGGEALVFQFTVARDVGSVLGFNSAINGFTGASFKLINPQINCAVVRIQNPVMVSQISALYDGRIKAQLPGPTPEAPPTSLSLPMVVAHKRFVWARTIIPKSMSDPAVINSSSSLGLTFSGVNEASVSAIVLRFRYRPGANSEANAIELRQSASKYLGAEEPDIVIKDLQARINDVLIPLRGISDLGATDIPVFGDGGAVPTDANGTRLIAQTSQGTAASLFDLGRGGLGLFMEDDFSQSLSDVVFDKTAASGKLPQIAGTAGVIMKLDPNSNLSLPELAGNRPITAGKSPMAICIIPLVSMPQMVGDFSNVSTCRSWDLRSVSSFSITGSVQVKCNATLSTGTGAKINSFVSAPEHDIIVDGALVCDGMLRLAAGSSDSRYIYTAVANATVASM